MNRIKVLIVEDTALLASIYDKVLTHEGYQTLRVNSVDQAIEMLASYNPDVIYLDWFIGEQTGADIITHLQTYPAEMRPHVIVVTSDYDVHPDGADAILRKPVALGDFRVAFETIAQRPRQPYHDIQIDQIAPGVYYYKWSGLITAEHIRAAMQPELKLAHTVIFDLMDLSLEEFRLTDVQLEVHPSLPNLHTIHFVCDPSIRELTDHMVGLLGRYFTVTYHTTVAAAMEHVTL